MLSQKMILREIGKNMKNIKRYGIKKMGLFGSYVRDEQYKGSDLDILVEFEKGKKTFDNYMELKFFLEDLFKCKVDLVIKESIKADLKPYISREVSYATGL